MRKSELQRLLKSVPGDPEVTIWMPETHGAIDGCDADIDQAVSCDGMHGDVLVLGSSIPLGELTRPTIIWEG